MYISANLFNCHSSFIIDNAYQKIPFSIYEQKNLKSNSDFKFLLYICVRCIGYSNAKSDYFTSSLKIDRFKDNIFSYHTILIY